MPWPTARGACLLQKGAATHTQTMSAPLAGTPRGQSPPLGKPPHPAYGRPLPGGDAWEPADCVTPHCLENPKLIAKFEGVNRARIFVEIAAIC